MSKIRLDLLNIARAIFLLLAIAGLIRGIVIKSTYAALLSASTLILPVILELFWRLARLKRGRALEAFIYIFAIIGWSLGGALEFYRLIPHFDKLAHTLSGAFTALMAFSLFMFLERGRARADIRAGTAVTFVFFASMAVAALFELCEFAIAPIVGLDLQRVKTTGVGDSMLDMLVCMIGTLPALIPVWRYCRGKDGAFAAAPVEFLKANGFL